jgi:hypothetical protein
MKALTATAIAAVADAREKQESGKASAAATQAAPPDTAAAEATPEDPANKDAAASQSPADQR